MTAEFIEQLVRRVAPHGLASLEYALGNTALRLVFEPAPKTCRTPGLPGTAINSPGIGLLRLRHPLGGDLPMPGSAVRRGEVVALLQAGPLLHAVTAPSDGVLGPALREDGEATGYGDPVFVFSAVP